MKIGIIGAMEIEVEGLKHLMNNISKEVISGITFYEGKIFDKDVVVAKCGVGKVHAAMCAQTMIFKYSPNAIINTGVAGSLDSSLDIADLVISDYLVQHDMDTTGVGDSLGFISGIDIIKIPASPQLVHKLLQASKILDNTNVKVGIIATGDQFVCDLKDKSYIVDNFKALCTEMEGGSIAQVCYINNIDFCVIRSISDKADGSAHMDFPSFVKIAAKKSTELMLNFLKSL